MGYYDNTSANPINRNVHFKMVFSMNIRQPSEKYLQSLCDSNNKVIYSSLLPDHYKASGATR